MTFDGRPPLRFHFGYESRGEKAEAETLSVTATAAAAIRFAAAAITGPTRSGHILFPG